ncbi:DNA ligase D [Ornithinibacillus halotolerans]|uniref:DNA ligase (ATP) n=1 Tax=Ornithinibacillus halotolerans TaxID=1274357 RepID=A0A916RP24_9BACI|nr:DNA ligase D [Ornithinibacillus halotolerans]GGA63790.1 bifunctional non-homologous end joining protein LigD [Ornithinibacillus halotolerans]
MDVMKPIASQDIPTGSEWLYEVKYDGFRCVLHWEASGEIRLTSKNKKDLTAQFPEIVTYCKEKVNDVKQFLPVKIDGELVILNNAYQGNFGLLQTRGRLKNKTSIQKASTKRQASLLAFDLIQFNGSDLTKKPFEERKKALLTFFNKSNLGKGTWSRLAYVTTFQNPEEISKLVFDHKGEGIIAKRKTSTYGIGKTHRDWYKIKNWREIHAFLTTYDSKNGYFDVHVLEGEHLFAVGKCKHGIDDEELNTVKKLFLTNGEKQGTRYTLPPAICASIHTLDIYDNELREPEFNRIAPEVKPEECTKDRLQLDLAMLPQHIDFANTEKLYWPDVNITKGNFLSYMREISPYMLPFLKNRALTTIRCPDGVTAESFYQKHLPSYAPEFITGIGDGDEKLMICDSLESLMWFANHGTLEFHVPFQTITSVYPNEIVFDLDPPGREKFSLAITAGLLIKELLDNLKLTSYVKTSGNKGLQIHIPIPEGSMSYEETGVFTQAIAYTVENQQPDLFTTERMKNKRKGRLYIDYVQHGKDKTIIAPYSTRKTPDGTVATPLYWEEVTEKLRPEMFTVENVVERVQTLGCPFQDYFHMADKQDVEAIKNLIQ